MRFKKWFNDEEFMEMSDVRNMPVDGVHFEPLEEDEFDEEEAERKCEKEVGYEDYGHRDGIYDDPHEDPDFPHSHPDNYDDENPPPDPDDYEDGAEDVDYISDTEEWQREKKDHAKTYHAKVAEWEKDMSKKRTHAEDRESEARWDAIQGCLEKKRQEWAEENKDNGGFLSKFQHGNDEFEVTMYKTSIEYAGHAVPGSFKIEFSGPNGYNTTNKAGGEATAIYTKVLLAVKKLMTTQQVNGLTFEPAEPGMALVYQRFYDRFLKNDFVRVSKTEAVRKTFVEQINKQLQPWRLDQVNAGIAAAGQEMAGYMQQIKGGRADERKLKAFAMAVVNKVVQTTTGHNIFVSRVFHDPEENRSMVEGVTDQGGIYHAVKWPVTVVTQTPSEQAEGNKLLTAITRNQRWMKIIDQKSFRPLLARYGVEEPEAVAA